MFKLAAHDQSMRLILSLAALVCAGALSAPSASPLVIYNGSPSAPIGFYVRRAGAPELGDFVTVRASAVAHDYAQARRFAGPRNWFIKRVAALGGAHMCAADGAVTINHLTLARLSYDRWHRPLPAWAGCRDLEADEMFLMGETVDSFDSRYWGPVHQHDIAGIWSPLFVVHSRD